jgi:ACS family tartrate transporter-like MFS transporter
MPRASTDEAVFRKCAWRLLPLITAGFLINFLDRTNVGFAALTINRELGFTPSVYGLAAGIFFVSYSIFQIPANLMLHRIGARRWLFLILVAWGAAAAATATSAQASNLHSVAGNPLLQTAAGRQKSNFAATGMSDTVVLSI